MMEATANKRYTLSEYQQSEEETGVRYEYHNGEVFAMSGGSPEHSAIVINVSDVLLGTLPAGCRRFNSDLKVYVPAVDKSFHPDLTVACRPIEKPDEINAISNPILLVEVLSESTSAYDPVSTAGGKKFWYFSQLPSLREYVLIEQDRWAVETRYRESAESKWTMEYYEGAEAEVIFRSIDLQTPIDRIYEDTEGL